MARYRGRNNFGSRRSFGGAKSRSRYGSRRAGGGASRSRRSGRRSSGSPRQQTVRIVLEQPIAQVARDLGVQPAGPTKKARF